MVQKHKTKKSDKARAALASCVMTIFNAENIIDIDKLYEIKLIREDAAGKREIIMLNLNDAEIVTGPYYYLQQNDILYVNPNKTKAKNSDVGQSTSLWFSATSILVSIASLLVTIFR